MRPREVFDPKLQHERTTLAWERTAFSGVIVGSLMTRIGVGIHPLLGGIGLFYVCASVWLLLWTGRHYEQMFGPLRAGESPLHRSAVAVVGAAATTATVAATVLALVNIIHGS